MALVRALDVAPPRQLGVELVLQGAGDGAMTGCAATCARRRSERRPATTIVLGIGAVRRRRRRRWWISDGSLIPLRYPAPAEPRSRARSRPRTELGAAPHRGRGVSPALPARVAGLPAITIGCLDGDGLAPALAPARRRSRRRSTAAPSTDCCELALTLVDAIDADLRSRSAQLAVEQLHARAAA